MDGCSPFPRSVGLRLKLLFCFCLVTAARPDAHVLHPHNPMFGSSHYSSRNCLPQLPWWISDTICEKRIQPWQDQLYSGHLLGGHNPRCLASLTLLINPSDHWLRTSSRSLEDAVAGSKWLLPNQNLGLQIEEIQMTRSKKFNLRNSAIQHPLAE